MNVETRQSIDPETEATQEKWETLIRRAQAAYNENSNRMDKNSNYDRIVGNLINPANPEVLVNWIGDDGAYQDAIEGLDYFDRYMALIKNFPEFAEQELSTPEGMFPNIDGLNNTNSYLVVDEIEKKLRHPESSNKN